mgnify:CR=1 FL=1
MEPEKLIETLAVAERLKDATRHCYTSRGRRESVAEQSWRITLMAYLVSDEFPEADLEKLMKMCLIHDLGEAFTGDIPTFEKSEKDEEKEAELILYDNNGKIVDSTQIENNLGDEGLKVQITMLQTKSIPVEFDTSMIGTASGYHFSGITIQPESIQIVGTEEQLAMVDSIEIPAEELAEDGLDQTIEKTVDIANYLPYWAKTDQDSAGGVPIVIKIQVEKFGTKTVEFPYNSIALLNAPKDYKVSYAEQGDLEIVVRGSKEDLDDFTLEKGSVSINLNDCKTAGTYNVPIQVTLPDGIELEDTINVQITLTKSSGGENDQ